MSFPAVLRSELTKLSALRSTRWTLLAYLVVTIGIGTLASFGSSQAYSNGDIDRQIDPAGITQFGGFFGQVAIALLGVLAITTEYGTGSIRSTFTAVPNRWRVLTAKGLLVLAAGLVVGFVAAFVSYGLGSIFFHEYGVPNAALSDPGVLRAVIGGGLYAGACALFGFAVGAAMRHSAGAIVVAIAGLLVAPLVTQALPGTVGRAIARYFTSNAGSQITSTVTGDNGLTPWVGFGVFCVWWAAILAVAYVLVRNRDA